MDSFEQLRQVTERAQTENELPDFLARQLVRIAEQADHYGQLADQVAQLAAMVEQYDTYAQTGYMGMGVNNAVLEGAIRRIEQQAGPMPIPVQG
jgi:hypothetical protein